MKIYLAGASAEREPVEADAARLEAAGYTITEPWWRRIHEARSLGYATDADVPNAYMAESAARNEAGIRVAQAVLFRAASVDPKRAFTAGAAYELALAKAEAKWRAQQRSFLTNARWDARTHQLMLEVTRGALAPLPIVIYGDAKRFIGIWEPPVPQLVGDLDGALKILDLARRSA